MIFMWRYATHLNDKAVNYTNRLKTKKALKEVKKRLKTIKKIKKGKTKYMRGDYH